MKQVIFTLLFSAVALTNSFSQGCASSLSPAGSPTSFVLSFPTGTAATDYVNNSTLQSGADRIVTIVIGGITRTFRFTGFVGSAAVFQSVDGTIFPTNTALTVTGVGSCSYQSSGPLPIELSGFGVALQGKEAVLHWETASEQNNFYFNIERSFDGINFSTIGTMAGKGNSFKNTNYIFTDKNLDKVAASNKIYYRLKQTDFDHKSSLSNVVAVQLKQKSGQLEMLDVKMMDYNDEVVVRYMTPEAGRIQAILYDITGRIYQNISIDATLGFNEIKLDINEKFKGIFVLSLTDGKDIVTSKIIRQ